MESESATVYVDGESTIKRLKSGNDSIVIKASVTSATSLLDLSDDVLLIIFGNLAPCDLFSLGRSCVRLSEVIRDRTLWVRVDCRATKTVNEQLAEYAECLHATTKTLAVAFIEPINNESQVNRPAAEIVRQIVCRATRLHTLVLQGAVIDAKEIEITEFPSTLHTLSLMSSTIHHLPCKASYFFNLHVHMPNLQVLVLSYCYWFQAHSFMAVAKCEGLRELRLDGCYQLGNCMAYCSMSARFAFKALELLDLRGTRMGDSEVACFNRVASLRHLYLSRAIDLPEEDPDRPASDWVTEENILRFLPNRNGGAYADNSPRCLIILQRVDNQFVVNRHVALRPDIHDDEVGNLIRVVGDHLDADDRAGREDPEDDAPRNDPVVVPEPLSATCSFRLVNRNRRRGGSANPSSAGEGSRGRGERRRNEKRGHEDDDDSGGKSKRRPNEASAACDNGNSSKAIDINVPGGGESRCYDFSGFKQLQRITIHVRRGEGRSEGASETDVTDGDRDDDGRDKTDEGEEKVDALEGCSKDGDIKTDDAACDDERKETDEEESDDDDYDDDDDDDDDDDQDVSPPNTVTTSRVRLGFANEDQAAVFHDSLRRVQDLADPDNGVNQDSVRQRLADANRPQPGDDPMRAANDMNPHAVAYVQNPEPIAPSQLITDSAVFDLFGNHEHSRLLVLRMPCDRAAVSRLESLVLREFPGVTDNSLLVLAEVTTLRYLDVTGTGVTLTAVQTFKALRPDVVIVTSFDESGAVDLDDPT